MSPIRLVIIVLTGLAVAAAAPTQTRFQRDPALLRAKQSQLIDAVRASDPQTAAQLARAFRGDVAAQVAPAFRPYGFSVDDAADMTAAYWITAWEASHGLVGTATDPAVARGVRAQLAKEMGPRLAGRSDAVKQDIADTMLLQLLIAEARMAGAKAAGPQAVEAMSNTIYREASALLKVDLRAVAMSTGGFKPVAARAGQRAQAPHTAPSPSTSGGRTASVSGTYFRAIAGSGAAVDFEPLVLFADGSYVELDETPLADLDAAADKARSPRRWGKWQRQGATFLLTGSDGRTNDYRLGTGNFFPAFAAAAGPPLAGSYSRTSGGGSFLPGGAVTVVAVNRIAFNAYGSFREGKSAGGIAPNATIGNRSAAQGRWRLDGSALELTYADGRRLRTSFLWGASGSPARPTANMAFIGGDTFTRD